MFANRLVIGVFSLAFLVVSSVVSTAQAGAPTHAATQPRWECDRVDGLAEGEALLRYPDGSVMVRGTFRRGVKHGVFFFYERDGSLVERALFVEGKQEWHSTDTSGNEPAPMHKLTTMAPTHPKGAVTAPPTTRFQQVIPFSGLDRLSSRMGVAIGTSTESGELAGRRIEFFINKVKGKFGVHSSLALTTTTAEADEAHAGKFFLEQLSMAATGSYRVINKPKHLGFIRAGVIKSIDVDPADDTPVRGVSAGQRPADFAANLRRALVGRISANHFYMRPNFISQIDVGVDIANHESTDDGAARTDAIIRLNAGIATGTKSWQFALETANAINGSGPSYYSAGGTITYYAAGTSWTSLNSMTDHYGETSLFLSVGAWLGN